MATKHVASWVHSLQYSTLPENVINAAVRSFYNWVGCAIGGSQHEATEIAYTTLKPLFGPLTASLLGRRGQQADPQHAALINGIASHVHDYDDTHLDTIIHPTGPVASALLAATEWLTTTGGPPVSGEAFIVALVAGIEVECKVGLAVWPQHYDVGWHITSTTGSIGAAAAVAKLFGLDQDKTAHAIGLASTQVVGLREMFGSHTKSFHPGRAAQNGFLAGMLARSGWTSSEGALEATRGWANVVSPTKEDVQADLSKWVGLGDSEVGLPDGNKGRWEILRNSFKPFPCGIVIHPIINACAQLHADMQKEGLQISEIDHVQAQVHPLVLELTGKKTPQDGLQGKFSVYHGGACGLVFGKATPSQYEDSVVLDAEVVGVRDRIDAVINKDLAADAAIVTVTMRDGKVLEKHVDHAVGSLEVPLDDRRLEEKFLDQCKIQDAEAVSSLLWKIRKSGDVAALFKSIHST
ncbi:mmge/prpd family protein-like protein [Xylariaceae sp. FL0255]|nr:mmge/prpd family protein-like protein [Xylariaceae sp. FL0255]